MKKLFISLLFIFLSACGARYQAQAAAPNDTQYPSVTPSIVPTETSIPTATIDYQSTAIIAQQTSDEARRVNAQITAAFEERVLQQAQITAEHERNVMQVYSWTATAALTSVPLTATQQVIDLTQIAQSQSIIGAQLTATYQAPTQIMAMAHAENAAKYSRIGRIGDIIGKFAISVFAIGLVIFMFRYPMQPKPMAEPEPEPVTETVVWLRNVGGATSTRYAVPVTPEQFTEFATKITQGLATLAINNWEGRDTLFNREAILRLRGWLHENEFVVNTLNNQLAPKDELLDFLIGWLDTQKLPTEYEFTQQPENPVADTDLEPLVQVVPRPNLQEIG